jgi:hypothetical protein
MTRTWFAYVLLAALGLGQPAAAADAAAVQTAPAGGQLVAGGQARMIVPEGWNWALRGTGIVLAASPNVPPEFFAAQDPKLTDDMATCFDLSEQRSYFESETTLEGYMSRQAGKMTAGMNKTTEANARAVSFVERRNVGGRKAVVAVVADSADQFGANFTGIFYLEMPKTKYHLVCKATFSSDKGPYGDRPTMKSFLQLINSFAPL